MEKLKQNDRSKIKHILAVTSGKGGVGKSFLSSLIASQLQRMGHQVGILDADITGPSIPKAFGLGSQAYSDGTYMLPEESRLGIRIMSVNLILEDPTQPLVWRSSLINQALEQFYEEVAWGDLDYLIIDMPPGTGDVALTTYQRIPLDGIIMVSSPQDLVGMIVEKSINMAKKVQVPLVGLVENMSYLTCPSCLDAIELFGPSKLREEGEKFAIDNLLKVPLDPDFRQRVDKGQVEAIQVKGLEDFCRKLPGQK
ncbi:MAG: Mrp/NBP35 family ATP-binding protein [Tissierellia bacterium]|nr:Mrp/NBP35 family ATP-binding protein [Tissierellia bacterium]